MINIALKINSLFDVRPFLFNQRFHDGFVKHDHNFPTGLLFFLQGFILNFIIPQGLIAFSHLRFTLEHSMLECICLQTA